MRTGRITWWMLATLLLAATGCVGSTAGVAQADVRAYGGAVGISYFYDDLSAYGRWMEVPAYGWCWLPDVPAGWRPYTVGTWAYTDLGWTWVSYEPWGWAVFHYGSWYDDPVDGWIWVPGTVWAPAWVAWRYDDDDIGWAPLAPGTSWSVVFGLRTQSAVAVLPAHNWCFVERAHFLDRDLAARVRPVAENRHLLARTILRDDYGVRDGRPFDRGVEVRALERSLGRSVPRSRIADLGAPERGRTRGSEQGALGIFRPEVRRAAPGETPRPEARIRLGRTGGFPSVRHVRGLESRDRDMPRGERWSRSRGGAAVTYPPPAGPAQRTSRFGARAPGDVRPQVAPRPERAPRAVGAAEREDRRHGPVEYDRAAGRGQGRGRG